MFFANNVTAIALRLVQKLFDRYRPVVDHHSFLTFIDSCHSDSFTFQYEIVPIKRWSSLWFARVFLFTFNVLGIVHELGVLRESCFCKNNISKSSSTENQEAPL